MRLWLAIITLGILTFAIRLSFILALGRMEVPPLVLRALRYVPPAVLSAIIVPELVMPGGTLNLSLGNPRLLAGLLATAVAWLTKNVLLTIAAGMLALWALQILLP